MEKHKTNNFQSSLIFCLNDDDSVDDDNDKETERDVFRIKDE